MIDLPNNTFAFTTSNISSSKNVGNVLLSDYATRSDGKVFDGDILQAMYAQITGDKNATLSTVSDKIDASTAYGGQNIYNSNDIRNANKSINSNTGKDIVLTMDGMQWTVTSLVKVGSDIIATLWLANTSYIHEWNLWYTNDTSIDYPSNIYGTSYIRAEGLNIGGGYVASQDADSMTDVEQSEEHPYAKFTMPSVTGSLTKFLVKPSAVGYQGVENQYPNSMVGGIGYSLPNEAYGTPTGSTNWYSDINNSIDMSMMPSKAGYTNWKEDLIWLPSLTETGYSSSVYGIWGLSDNQRSNSAVSWLRSASHYSTHGAYYLAAAGSSTSRDLVPSSYAVRPALHLNLTSAQAHAVTSIDVQDFSATYTGEQIGISSAEWYNSAIYG
ncbi:MAG: hypothetical protein K2I79_04025, partial [Clostridia bacterium]|nr:hypothetical protein [Clostridia bacterium]